MGKLKRFTHVYKNQKGLTLVELLAVIVLLSLVLLLVSSIHLMGLKQYSTQSQSIKNQENTRLAMTMITKDIRRSTSISVADSTDLKLVINNQPVTYSLNQWQIDKNGRAVVSGVQFSVSPLGDQLGRVTLKVTGAPEENGNQPSLTSTLLLKQ